MIAFLLHIITLACILLFTTTGLNIIFGKGKILYFGIEGMSLIAGYALWAVIVKLEQPYIVGLLSCIICTGVIAGLFGWLSIRLKEDAFGVMSLALHLMILAIILNWQSLTRGALGIPKIPRGILPQTTEGFALFTIIMAVCWLCGILIFNRSRYGRAISAISEHPWHGESLGISRLQLHMIMFGIAGIGVIFTNMLYAPFLHLLSPTDYQFSALIFMVMIVVAGSPGSVWGCALATFLLTFLKEGIRFIHIPMMTESGWTMAALPSSIKGPTNLILFGLILFVAVWIRKDVLFPKQRVI